MTTTNAVVSTSAYCRRPAMASMSVHAATSVKTRSDVLPKH